MSLPPFPVGLVEVGVFTPEGAGSEPVRVPITLSPYESELFSIILGTTSHFDALKSTTVRVAGGWVRDKVLDCGVQTHG
jgi:hypothetical protein